MLRAGLILLALIAVVGLADEMMMKRWHGATAPSTAAAASAAQPDSGGKHAKDDPPADEASAQTAQCSVVQPPRPLPSDLPEASGAAASVRTPGIVWVQNDSRGPEIFAVAQDGTPRGRVRVTAAQAVDWEDLAMAPCDGGSCLYIGDVGDNAGKRAGVTVYRVHEPAPGDPATFPAEAFRATYPDGSHDAEAIFALPQGGVFILTKGETGAAALYRYPEPMRGASTARLQRVAEFSDARMKRSLRFTGAAASPDGRWVAVRTLRSVHFYRAADLVAGRPGTPLEWDATPLGEKQGEGIAFARGDTLILTSEGGAKRVPGTIERIACQLPR
ncbi:MAG TPA: hypothetical protein VFH27_04805 [Longimicrobiaceae bacterium]|nr:hypothetical protein [Longimicrobiaceae bacterium]